MQCGVFAEFQVCCPGISVLLIVRGLTMMVNEQKCRQRKKEIKMGHMSVDDDDDDVSVDLGGSDIKNTANEKNIK